MNDKYTLAMDKGDFIILKNGQKIEDENKDDILLSVMFKMQELEDELEREKLKNKELLNLMKKK